MPTPSLVLKYRRAMIAWLVLCCLLVVGMVVIGGYTRLSGSGLSITEWKPIHGVIPPLGEMEWHEEFEAYKISPQYIKVNQGMSLEEFKTIYWPEYWHRVLGRLIGLVFFFPLVVFWLSRSISKHFAMRLLLIFALGGLQGAVGWIMVKSGLVDEPRVSHLKLALHLSLAFALLALLFWAVLDVIKDDGVASTSSSVIRHPSSTYFTLWFALLCLQIIYGAFMSGLHAGLIYNTWPSMNGDFLPPDAMQLTPWPLNFLYNITTVQLVHRNLAVILAIAYVFWWLSARKTGILSGVKQSSLLIPVLIFAQFCLGVVTLLQQAPLHLAWAHQFTGLALFVACVWQLHSLRRMR